MDLRASYLTRTGQLLALLGLVLCVACGRLNYERLEGEQQTQDPNAPPIPADEQFTPTRISAEMIAEASAAWIPSSATTSSMTLDTSTGVLTNDFTSMQEPWPEGVQVHILPQTDINGTTIDNFPGILVISATDIEVSASLTIHVTGDNGLLLVAQNDLTLDGILDATAGNDDGIGTHPGPGGFRGGETHADFYAEGPGAGENCSCSACQDYGGGGGGHLHPGGDVGSRDGGAAYGDANFTLLIGGSGGAGGYRGQDCGRRTEGGGGGGGIQLSSAQRLTIGAQGGINVAGAGGSGDGAKGGGGGGSGGTIILEAHTLTINGTLTANGGSGGGGGSGGNGSEPKVEMDEDGVPGRFDALIAQGGAGYFSDGGNGGAGDTLPTNSPTQAGGGGSAGRIMLRHIIEPIIDDNAIISPSNGFFTQAQ